MENAVSFRNRLRTYLSAIVLMSAAYAHGDNPQYVATDCYWTPNDSVSWYKTIQNDGILQPEETTKVVIGESLNLWVEPKKGWAVDHWRKSSKSIYATDTTCGVPIDNSEGETNLVWVAESSANVFIAVKFRYLTYDLAYEGHGAPAGKSDVAYTNRLTVATVSSSPSGYAFANWRDDSGMTYVAGASVKGESFHELDDVHVDGEVVTLTAQWTPVSYGIVYDLGEGAVWPKGASHPATATYDASFTVSDPSRLGYSFKDWKVGKETYASTGGTTTFLNLTNVQDAVVTLVAEWTPLSTRVHFNGMGATSGPGDMNVTFGTKPDSILCPTWAEHTFRGYWTEKQGGEKLWDEIGQWCGGGLWAYTNATMDVFAHWSENDTRVVTFDTVKDGNRNINCTKGSPFGPYFQQVVIGGSRTNATDILLGWYTNDTCRVLETDLVPGGTGELILTAKWDKEVYFIAFDGNGETEGTMPVMTNKFDESISLPSNAFVKTGYTFAHWRDVAGKVTFADGQAGLKNILNTGVRQTNTLYAVWQTNAYTIALDPNGGVGERMNWKTVRYGEAVLLPIATNAPIGYTNGAYDFVGWSNDVAKVVYANLSEPVSNLCAAANGTNTLYAVWKLNALSEAVHCTNLRWVSHAFADTYNNAWEPAPDGLGVWQYGDKSRFQQWFTAQVPTNGSLSFVWKPVACEGDRYLSYWVTDDIANMPTSAELKNLVGELNQWNSCMIADVRAGQYVCFYVSSTYENGYCQVDQMTWTPESAHPVPGPEDAAKIGFAAVDGNRFVLSFAGTNAFDYVLKTNADLRVDSWGAMGKTNGATTVVFEPRILPDQPQLFYKVETVQRK